MLAIEEDPKTVRGKMIRGHFMCDCVALFNELFIEKTWLGGYFKDGNS